MGLIHLNNDTRDGAGSRIFVSCALDAPDGHTANADLDRLVEAAVFAPFHRVARRAHTADAIRSTLDDNAMWLRRLMPVLRAPDAIELVEKASRFETDQAGNPKRRPQNIKWRYD